jgi:ketosteroid isomerase-like protein
LRPLELVRSIYSGEDEPIDIGSFLAQRGFARFKAVTAPTAAIEFPTPDGGLVGEMAGPFHGAEGLLASWDEWLEPWESFSIRGIEWVEADDDRVLLLADSTGRMANGVEIKTPVAALFDVQDGRIVRMRHYLDQAQARRVAGVD